MWGWEEDEEREMRVRKEISMRNIDMGTPYSCSLINIMDYMLFDILKQ